MVAQVVKPVVETGVKMAGKSDLVKKILGSLVGAAATGGAFAVGNDLLSGVFGGDDNSPVNENPQDSQQLPQPPAGQTPPAILPPVNPQTPGSIEVPDLPPRGRVEQPEIDIPELSDRTPDPQLQQYGDLINKITDPRYQYIVGEQNLDRQMRSRAQAAELTERKMDSMNKRLIEQENIRAWRDAFKAQTYANAQIALGTAGILMQLQRPNTQFMDSITRQIQAAQEAGLDVK